MGATDPSTSFDFNVGLQLRNAAGAVAEAQAVSDPSSASYRQYLTTRQWERQFSPTRSSVAAVTGWLQSQGITVDAVTPDRMTVEATGTAAQVASAFGTSLNQYRLAGQTVRLASGALSVPAELAGMVSGVTGVDEILATPDDTTGSDVAPAAAGPATSIPQPPGFRNPTQGCGAYYGQKADTTDPAYGDGFEHPMLDAVCGYTPSQLQSAYGLSSDIAEGDNGKGVTVAVVDAYASPTLFADAKTYSSMNQKGEVLKKAQFSESLASGFNDTTECQASGWFGEQTLDVEAVHAMAPGAHILYMGAKNCVTGLFNSVQQVVDAHAASIITDSWGDTAGDLLDPPGVRASFDNVLLMADGTGIGVQFERRRG